mgnify:CR=1 FL=1
MAEIKTQTLDSYLRVIEISRDLASTLDLNTLLDDIVRAAADAAFAALSVLLAMAAVGLEVFEQAEAIIDTQVGQFMHWMRLREGVPLIRALRDEADAARRRELEQALNRSVFAASQSRT